MGCLPIRLHSPPHEGDRTIPERFPFPFLSMTIGPAPTPVPASQRIVRPSTIAKVRWDAECIVLDPDAAAPAAEPPSPHGRGPGKR